MCYLKGNVRISLWIVLFLDKTQGDLRALFSYTPAAGQTGSSSVRIADRTPGKK